MKTWSEIKSLAERGDWERVASIAGCSRKNVEAVAAEKRPDNFNIQIIFSSILEHREELFFKHSKKGLL